MSFAILKHRLIPAFRVAIGCGAIATGSVVIGYMSTKLDLLRIALAVIFLPVLLAMSARFPRHIMLGLLLYLPLMGFIRRALIPIAGWNEFDPLVIVAPAVILLMGFYYFYTYYIRRQPKEQDTRLYRLVKWLILIDLLQVANPLQGGLFQGFGGIMFYVVPLVWMVLSRRFIDDRWLKIVYATVFWVGVLTALHGIRQSHGGFFSFELNWVKLAGYDSLMVGLVVRAFSTFTNAAEFAQFLGISIVISWIYILKGKGLQRPFGIIGFPILFYALLLESSRSSVVLTLLALAVVTVLNAKKEQRVLIALAAVVGIAGVFGAITNMASHDNALVAHLAGGLSNPLDQQDSTLGLHLSMFFDGFWRGIKNPAGYGLGSTTIAAAKIAGDGVSSEVDLSNMFISDGVLGGIVYMNLFFTIFKLGFRAAAGRDSLALTILGIMLFSAGQWAIGGNYSTAALIWLTIGQLDRITANRQGNRIEPKLTCIKEGEKE